MVHCLWRVPNARWWRIWDIVGREGILYCQLPSRNAILIRLAKLRIICQGAPKGPVASDPYFPNSFFSVSSSWLGCRSLATIFRSRLITYNSGVMSIWYFW